MNEKLLNYFELSLAANEATCESDGDKTLSELDNIWWNVLGTNEREKVNALMSEQYSRGKGVHEALVEIINLLQETKTMTSIFESKEEYIKLKNFWKEYHKLKLYQKIEVEGESYNYESGETDIFYYRESPLKSLHHLIYLTAVGKSLEKAIGNCKEDTVNYILYCFLHLRSRNSWFSLFDDAISKKYYDGICEQIIEYLKEKQK